MKPTAINPRSAGISLSGSKSEKASPLTARNVAITTFVVGLLGAIATILVWQLGGTCNWITYTVGGVSGALLISSAIAAMISYKSKSLQKPPSHSTTTAGISNSAHFSKTATPQTHTPNAAEPPKAAEPQKKLPSARDLKALNKNPCTWDGDNAHAYIGLAIKAGNTDLVREYLTEFTWKLDEGASVAFTPSCTLSYAHGFLTPTTPKPIVELFSKKLHELLKKEVPLIQDPKKTPYLNLRRGVGLVTEPMIREFASSPIIHQLLNVYPFDLPSDLIISDQEAVKYHKEWMESIHLEKMCKEGANVDTIIELMTKLHLQPMFSIRGCEPDESNASVFSLLIQSGKVEVIKAFIQRMDLSITPEIMKLAKEKGSDQVVSLLQTIAQERQARKTVAFDRISGMFMGSIKHPPEVVAKQFRESGLAGNDKALEGPYKGKTILQLIVENGLHAYVAPVMQPVPADRGQFLQVLYFFLGNASETDLINLSCVATGGHKKDLFAKRETDRARCDALKECSRLATDSQNQTEILRLMSEHDLQPDTVFPLMDCRTPLDVAASSPAAAELHKALTAMRDKQVALPDPNVRQQDLKLDN